MEEINNWKFLVKEGLRVEKILLEERDELICHMLAFTEFFKNLKKDMIKFERKQKQIAIRFKPSSRKSFHK